jgi:multisubunit Na+/H+ antiporter MnhC subunit
VQNNPMLTAILIGLAIVIFVLYMARRNSRKNRDRGPR